MAGIATVPDCVPSTVNWTVLFDAVTSGEVSLLFKPVNAPDTYAVIANAYEPAAGEELDAPLTSKRVEVEEYIELKIASNELGLFFNSVSNTLVLRLSSPFFSVLTPKFDRYTPLAPKPDNWFEVSVFNLEWILFITGSSDKSPASLIDEPLKILIRVFQCN